MSVICNNILHISGPKDEWNDWMLRVGGEDASGQQRPFSLNNHVSVYSMPRRESKVNENQESIVWGTHRDLIPESFFLKHVNQERCFALLQFSTFDSPPVDYLKTVSYLFPNLDFKLACNDKSGCGMFGAKNNDLKVVFSKKKPENVCTCKIYPEGGGSISNHCNDCNLPIDPENDFMLFHSERGLKPVEILQ